MNTFRKVRWRQLVFGAVLAFGGTYSAAGQTIPPPNQVKIVKPSDDDLLLLSLVLGSVDLSDELECYRNGPRVFLPLTELFRLLEISVRVNPTHGSAEGFLGRTDRPFRLEIAEHQIQVSGKELTFDLDLVQVHLNDIYVDIRALNTWFRLGGVFNPHASSVSFNPKELLPLQRRLLRESLASQLGSGFHGYRDPGYPRVPNPYGAFGDFAVDQSFAFGEADALGSKISAGRYSAQFATDMYGQGLTGSWAFASGLAPEASLAYGLKDPDGELLGSLHARETTMGAVESPEVPLVSDTHPAAGWIASNTPLSQVALTDTTCFSGPLKPGWDVQLFRETTLIAYQEETGTGKYEFKNVPLNLGINRFRLEFNGPLGERIEENQTRNVVGTLTPGTFDYSMFLSGDLKSPEWSTQEDFGLRRDLMAFSGLAEESLPDGSHDYSTVGMRGYLAGSLLTARFVNDFASGQAGQISDQWNWGGTSMKLNQTCVNRLESGIYGSNLNPEKSDTQLQVGNLAFARGTHLLPAEIEIEREETTLGNQKWDAQGRFAYQSNGLGITHLATWQSETGAPDQRLGELLITDWRNGNSMEGNLEYQWENSIEVTRLAVRTGQIVPGLGRLMMGLYSNPRDGEIGLTTTLSQSSGAYAYGIALNISRLQGIALGMSLSFGAIRDRKTGKWLTTAKAQATKGSVFVHVFFDANGTGRPDPHSPPVAGALCFVNDTVFQKRTGPDGSVLIDGLAAYRPTDIGIVEGSLENPLMVSKFPGLQVNPRPGSIQRIDLPVVATGEVSGTVTLQETKMLTVGAGVLVELVDKDGKVLQQQRSAFDGYYTLNRVPVGAHIVRATAYGMKTERSITVPPEGAFLDGIDMTVGPVPPH